MNVEERRSNATGSSLAHIAPSTAMVGHPLAPSPSFLSSCLTQAHPQIAPMTNHQIGDETPLLNISRPWSSNCNGPKPSSEMSCQKSIWMIHPWIPLYRLTLPPIRSMKIPQPHHQAGQLSGRSTIRSSQQARLRKIQCSNRWWRIRGP